MNRKKILLIDDEKDFCELIKMNLEIMGNFKVIVATAGVNGIKLAKQEKPDLIILDLIMPQMNGFEVLEQLKQDKRTLEIPVVVLTGRGDDEAKVKASKLYTELYITKPVGTLELKAKIEDILKMKAIQ